MEDLPIAPRASSAGPQRLNRKVIVGGTVLLVGMTAGLILWGITPAPPQEKPTAVPETRLKAHELPESVRQTAGSYEVMARQEAARREAAQRKVLEDAAQAAQVAALAQQEEARARAAVIDAGPQPLQERPAIGDQRVERPLDASKSTQNGHSKPLPEARQKPAPKAAAAPKTEKPKPWLFGPVETPGEGIPMPEPTVQKDAQNAERLFPQAAWAVPDDPTRIIYRSTRIPAILKDDVNSDMPGVTSLIITEDVRDKFNTRVLIPIGSHVHGKFKGTPRPGQRLIEFEMDGIEFRDTAGTYLELRKAQVGNTNGANGVTAEVNNHYVAVSLHAFLTALLSIGTRAPFGSPTNHAGMPSLPQEFAQDVGSSVNQTGMGIVQRSLQILPTLTQDRGWKVTIQLLDNVSLQTLPGVATK